MNDDDLLYSSDASVTRYLYYQGLNSINIFVEDEGKEYEYETIFVNMLGDQFEIATIFAAEGKQRLIKCYHEFGETDSTNILNFPTQILDVL